MILPLVAPSRFNTLRTRLAVGLLAAVACASGGPTLEPAERPDPRGLPRYGPECAAAIDRARREVLQPPPPGYEPPIATTIAMPPNGVPQSARPLEITYEVPVDSAGTPDHDRATVRGITDSRYALRFREVMRNMRFRPARLDGCAVPAVARFTVTVF